MLSTAGRLAYVAILGRKLLYDTSQFTDVVRKAYLDNTSAHSPHSGSWPGVTRHTIRSNPQ